MEIGIKRFVFDRINPTYIKFYPYFSRYFWPIIASIILTFAASSSGAVFPLVLKYLIDHVFFQKTITNPWPFLLLLLLLVIGLDFFRFFQAYLITKVELRLELHLRLALVKSLFFKKMSFVKKKHTGEIISLLNNDLRLAQHIPNLLIRIFLEFPIRMAICLGMMLYLDFYLGIFVFLVAPLVYIVLIRLRAYRRRLAEKKMKLKAQILQDFHEFIAGIKIIKMWNLVSFCSDKIQSHANSYLNQSLKEVKLNNLVRILMSIIVVLILCLLIYLGLHRIEQGNTTPGNYAGFFLALWYFSQPVKQIAMGYSTLLDATVAA
ncbi:MAG: ABC transporter ATP-binding protein, partial [Deltaproteobacteria bacterium]